MTNPRRSLVQLDPDGRTRQLVSLVFTRQRKHLREQLDRDRRTGQGVAIPSLLADGLAMPQVAAERQAELVDPRLLGQVQALLERLALPPSPLLLFNHLAALRPDL